MKHETENVSTPLPEGTDISFQRLLLYPSKSSKVLAKLSYKLRGPGLFTLAKKYRGDLTVSKVALATRWHYFCRSQRDFMLKLSGFTSATSAS